MTWSSREGRRATVYMIPPTIDLETPSPGERLVFERLAADQAHPDWIVLHSQDIARHRSQMESEADFVVVAPGCRRSNNSPG